MCFIAKAYVNVEPNIQIKLIVVFNVLFIPKEISSRAPSEGTDMPAAL